jgi:hypothetical protein
MNEILVSTGTELAIVVGLVVAYAYLRNMWGALQRAVRTRDDADEGQDRYSHSLVGAIVAVLGSVAAIALYGAAPALLYVGPALALLAAVAVTYCLRDERVNE